MPILYKLLALLVALGALVGLLKYAEHEHERADVATAALEDAKEMIRRTQATLTLREDLRATTALKSASARVSLQHAAATPAAAPWAAATVPMEVQNALCAHVRCAGADGLPSSPASAASAP